MTPTEIMPGSMMDSSFYLQPTIDVAKLLIGKILVKKIDDSRYISALIVETEAYLDMDDPASHSANGVSNRNAAMFEAGGILYVYKIFGIHYCINIVTEPKNKGCAVLIRAAMPLDGLEIMKANRGIDDEKKLCRGPGNLARAYGFDLTDNCSSLLSDKLFILDNTVLKDELIHRSPRIGITKGVDLHYRFFLKGSEYVSYNKKHS